MPGRITKVPIVLGSQKLSLGIDTCSAGTFMPRWIYEADQNSNNASCTPESTLDQPRGYNSATGQPLGQKTYTTATITQTDTDGNSFDVDMVFQVGGTAFVCGQGTNGRMQTDVCNSTQEVVYNKIRRRVKFGENVDIKKDATPVQWIGLAHSVEIPRGTNGRCAGAIVSAREQIPILESKIQNQTCSYRLLVFLTLILGLFVQNALSSGLQQHESFSSANPYL